jgi:N-acetylmuramoyl-L-alanine amidase
MNGTYELPVKIIDMAMAHLLKIYRTIPITLIVLIVGIGCTRYALPPPSTLQLTALDTKPLKDKVIVLDPGHGGTERGAIGPRGLMESEANLSVALFLWGLLNQAGAKPILTRSADTSVSTASKFSLENDLQARSDVSNRTNADLFISIHHNSDTLNRKKNDMQIYYKMSDAGQSRDIARSLLHALKERLKSKKADIFPGNYRVLRTTHAPAILGESSFMSNKKNEGMLSLQRTLQTEAEGYFMGILSYYQKGVPVISVIYPDNITIADPQPQIKARIQASTGSTDIDPGTLLCTLDGNRIRSCVLQDDGIIVCSLPRQLENGSHSACLTIRNKTGNSSRQTCASFTVSLPPALISMMPVFPVIPADGVASTAIDIAVSDALGRPVIDGTTVNLSASGGRLTESTLVTAQGKARGIISADTTMNTIQLRAEAGTIKAHTAIRCAVPDEALFSASVTDPSGNAVEGVAVLRNDKSIACSDNRGMVYDRAMAEGSMSYSFSKKGYASSVINVMLKKGRLTKKNIVLNQIDGGLFLKQKIMLDPEGSSQESFPLLYELKKSIEHAGGTVYLTRDINASPSLKERVVLAAQKSVDLYLSFEITGRQLSAGYYGKSVQGKRLAENICLAFNQNRIKGWKICSPAIFNHFITIQTQMPAVWIKLPDNYLKDNSLVSSAIYQALRNTLHQQQ